MRRRDRAQAVADDLGYGRYVRFASPSYEGEGFFFLPFALFFLWGVGAGVVRMFEHRATLFWLICTPLWFVGAVGFLVMCFWATFQRRPGGPATVLYCYERGVVVIRRQELSAYAWTDLTLHVRDWEQGGGEFHYYGTEVVLRDPAGTDVVVFTGSEPPRSGRSAVRDLHAAAFATASDSASDSASDPAVGKRRE